MGKQQQKDKQKTLISALKVGKLDHSPEEVTKKQRSKRMFEKPKGGNSENRKSERLRSKRNRNRKIRPRMKENTTITMAWQSEPRQENNRETIIRRTLWCDQRDRC